MHSRIASSVGVFLLSASLVAAQTPVKAPANKYKVSEDVQLGREAANEVRKQLPLLRDGPTRTAISAMGQRLVSAIPSEFRHPEFRYSFDVVNVREINAFALPGGPMFVNRGMLESAENEGQVASVMAHELSHVVLRHGTAQATKATKYQVGAIAGAILGAVIGGTAGSIVSQGTQFGLGTAFMRFSREFERDADTLGAQIMARAGYDPRDMANMFKLIEQEGGGSGGPEWLSSHPNPGNRYEAILREASMLRVSNPRGDSPAFVQMRAQLRQMPPAPTTEQAVRNTSGNGGNRTPETRGTGGYGRVPAPSSRFTTYREGPFQVSVPSNWQELQSGDSVTFAPDGAYAGDNGNSGFTHGMQIGIASNGGGGDVRNATENLIQSLAGSNPNMRRASGYSQTSIDNRSGVRTTLDNVSDATGGRERIEVFTAQLRDGSLFYALGVAPQNDFANYQNVFRKVMQSIQIDD